MSMTEDEAYKRWCPYFRTSAALSPMGDLITEHNRPRVLSDNPGYCIASQCMAWRWLMVSQSALGASRNNDGSFEWGQSTPRGHCGLAGQP